MQIYFLFFFIIRDCFNNCYTAFPWLPVSNILDFKFHCSRTLFYFENDLRWERSKYQFITFLNLAFLIFHRNNASVIFFIMKCLVWGNVYEICKMEWNYSNFEHLLVFNIKKISLSQNRLIFLVFISTSLPQVWKEGVIHIKSNLQICKFWKWLIFDKQKHCKPAVAQSKFLILMSFVHSV